LKSTETRLAGDFCRLVGDLISAISAR